MILNISIMVIVSLFFVVASVQTKKIHYDLLKMFGGYVLCGIAVATLSVFLGANLKELLTLKLATKSGVAMGIIYGCIAGTGVAYIASIFRVTGNKQ